MLIFFLFVIFSYSLSNRCVFKNYKIKIFSFLQKLFLFLRFLVFLIFWLFSDKESFSETISFSPCDAPCSLIKNSPNPNPLYKKSKWLIKIFKDSSKASSGLIVPSVSTSKMTLSNQFFFPLSYSQPHN